MAGVYLDIVNSTASVTAPSGISIVIMPSLERNVVPELVTVPPPTGSDSWTSALPVEELAPPKASKIKIRASDDFPFLSKKRS